MMATLVYDFNMQLSCDEEESFDIDMDLINPSIRFWKRKLESMSQFVTGLWINTRQMWMKIHYGGYQKKKKTH